MELHPDVDWDLDDPDNAWMTAKFEPPTTVRISFPGCDHSIEFLAGQVIPTDCPDCMNNVQSNGRCEDFPCCGHTDGDGCGFNPRHTSDYWAEWISKREAAGYDIDDPDFYPEGMD